MRWEDLRRSTNVEDRRGGAGAWGPSSRRTRIGGGGLGRLPGGVRVPVNGKTILVAVVVMLVASYYGIDLGALLDGSLDMSGMQGSRYERQAAPADNGKVGKTGSAEEDRLAQLSATVLGMTEDVWGEIFRKNGQTYRAPKMVLYRGAISSACGLGQSAMGPFYCPGDNKVYIDLSFYEDMKSKYGGGGEFALGYVLAHEVGHHVQTLVGTSSQVTQAQRTSSSKKANELSVRLELQADCLAGVWGHHVNRDGRLEAGDLERALKTATAIGDDRLQKASTGRVVPESFTHGTSEQRYRWFKRGYDAGDPKACDTFGQKDLDK